MKKLILLLAFIIPFIGFSQSENNSVRLDYLGTSGGSYSVLVTNKQTCTASIKVSYGNASNTVSVDPSKTATVSFTATTDSIVKAKTTTNCGGADMGFVSLNVKTAFVLPVKFTSFNATTSGSTIVLRWTTEELNVSYFVVQESSDANTWLNAGTVNAGSTSYSFTDVSPQNYYRILSVDIDGKTNYSRVIRLNIDSKVQLALYPNPVQNTTSISLKSGTVDKLQFYNSNGSLVKTIETKGNTSLVVDLSDLKKGIYFVNGVKFIKQ